MKRIDSPKILMKPIRCLTKEILTKIYRFLRYEQSQGGQDGADDGRTTVAGSSERSEIPEGEQEGKEKDSRRVRGVDRLSPHICELPVESARKASSGGAQDHHRWRHSEASPQEA